ncbi:MAG: hypothetical protein WDN09_04385 [bacterium]
MRAASTSSNNSDLSRRALHFMLLSLACSASPTPSSSRTWSSISSSARLSRRRPARSATTYQAMELTYLAESNKVDLALSYSMGFKETKATFATRKSLKSLGSVKVSNNEL